MPYEVISDVLTVKRLRLRTVKERGVCIAGDGEPFLDGIEQLPDDLLCVGTTYQPISVPVLDAAPQWHSPCVMGTCSGELHGTTTRVESLNRSSGTSFCRWNCATLYGYLGSFRGCNWRKKQVSDLQKRPSLRFKPGNILSEVKMVPDVEHLQEQVSPGDPSKRPQLHTIHAFDSGTLIGGETAIIMEYFPATYLGNPPKMRCFRRPSYLCGRKSNGIRV